MRAHTRASADAGVTLHVPLVRLSIQHPSPAPSTPSGASSAEFRAYLNGLRSTHAHAHTHTHTHTHTHAHTHTHTHTHTRTHTHAHVVSNTRTRCEEVCARDTDTRHASVKQTGSVAGVNHVNRCILSSRLEPLLCTVHSVTFGTSALHSAFCHVWHLCSAQCILSRLEPLLCTVHSVTVGTSALHSAFCHVWHLCSAQCILSRLAPLLCTVHSVTFGTSALYSTQDH
jgi:hypothetical protein